MTSPDTDLTLSLERDLPTTGDDIVALRRARQRKIDPATVDWNWLSLGKQFPQLERRRRTHRGIADFELGPAPALQGEPAK